MTFVCLTIITTFAMDEIIEVDVKVGALLREFVISANGSDLLMPQKDDVLWCICKQNLLTAPPVPVVIKDRTEYIRIALVKTAASSKVYNIYKEENIRINTLFRNFFNEDGQARICNYLMKLYHSTFIVYMESHLKANPDIQIKQAIANFLTSYNIMMDHITHEALRKYWYRHQKRNEGREKNMMQALI